MKVCELMDNDLFMYGGHLCRFKIRAMDAVIERLSDGGCYPPCACAEAEPITLTKEILEKNGFKWTDTWRAYCYIGDNRKFVMVTHDEDEGFGIHSTSICFHYVHQLQHALRLYGLDALVDNFKA